MKDFDDSRLSDPRVARAIGQLDDSLRKRGLRMTRIRQSIAIAALRYPGHFSVEQLVGQLVSDGLSDVHVATVYRCIPHLVEAGLVQPALVAKQDGQYYETTFEKVHHDHLVCVSCGKVVEIHSEALEALQKELAQREGFELHDHVLELRGRCRRCIRAATQVTRLSKT